MRDATLAGYGLAQIHDYYVGEAIADGRLETVLEKYKPAPDAIWLVYPQTRHLSPRVRAFIDFIVPKFQPSGAEGAQPPSGLVESR